MLLQGAASLSSPGDSPTRESVVLSLKRDLEEAPPMLVARAGRVCWACLRTPCCDGGHEYTEP